MSRGEERVNVKFVVEAMILAVADPVTGRGWASLAEQALKEAVCQPRGLKKQIEMGVSTGMESATTADCLENLVPPGRKKLMKSERL